MIADRAVSAAPGGEMIATGTGIAVMSVIGTAIEAVAGRRLLERFESAQP